MNKIENETSKLKKIGKTTIYQKVQPGKCVGVGAVKTILCLRCHEWGDGPPRAWKYNRRLSELGTTCHITSQTDNGKCRTNGQFLTELEVVPISADVENTKCKHEA